MTHVFLSDFVLHIFYFILCRFDISFYFSFPFLFSISFHFFYVFHFFLCVSVPMKLPGHHLRPIPKVLEDMQPNAYVGGLARCVPIEKVCVLLVCIFTNSNRQNSLMVLFFDQQSLNFATMTYDTHCINDFPEYLVNNAKQMIEEAAEIYFTPCQKIGKHIFGDVSITTYSGKKKDLLHMLTKTDSVQAGEAFIAKGKFSFESRKMCGTLIAFPSSLYLILY